MHQLSGRDPYTTEDINRLDKVQRRAARFVANNYTDRTPECVTAMVNSLGCEPLIQRRLHHRLIMMFKTIHGDVDIPEAASMLKTGDRRTRGAHRLHLPFTSVKAYKLSFYPRTIQDLNVLPTAITNITELKDFKAALHSMATVPQPTL